jgi:hypothetical protein
MNKGFITKPSLRSGLTGERLEIKQLMHIFSFHIHVLKHIGAAVSSRSHSKKSLWYLCLNFLLHFPRHRNFPVV